MKEIFFLNSHQVCVSECKMSITRGCYRKQVENKSSNTQKWLIRSCSFDIVVYVVEKLCVWMHLSVRVNFSTAYLHCLVLLLSTCGALGARLSTLLVSGRTWGKSTQVQHSSIKSHLKMYTVGTPMARKCQYISTWVINTFEDDDVI